jgi:serine/threonine protein phosphatase PrpC
MENTIETDAQVGWLTNRKKHAYEDRYRLLGGGVPAVARAGRGHLYAIMDGVGGAPLGMRAAQHVADRLTAFYTDGAIEASVKGLLGLCQAIDREVNAFGLIQGEDRPLGAAAATVAWLDDRARRLGIVHAGDTTA